MAEEKTFGFSHLSQSKSVIEARVGFHKTKKLKNFQQFDEKPFELNCTICQQRPAFHNTGKTMNALERFRTEFRGWVRALNRTKGLNASPDEVLERLESRIPEAMLRQIGGAFINGWLQSEPEPTRKYFIRESDRKGRRGGQWVVGHAGGGNVDPCWELHVQLADYSRIRTVAERHRLITRLEDQLMDITVYAGSKLLLYVENKTKNEDALRLLGRMKEYGETGFDLEDPDKGNDPLRKAKYLVRDGARPQYFALSAIGFEQVFRVEYPDGENRFLLLETELSLTGPLLDKTPEGNAPPRSIVDPLALEFDRLVGDLIWVSPGSGATAYNFYVPTDLGDGIFLGVYEDGRVWSDITSFGNEIVSRLSGELALLGIELDTSKDWCFWRKKDEMLNLHEEDPLEIATRVVAALFPGSTEDEPSPIP